MPTDAALPMDCLKAKFASAATATKPAHKAALDEYVEPTRRAALEEPSEPAALVAILPAPDALSVAAVEAPARTHVVVPAAALVPILPAPDALPVAAVEVLAVAVTAARLHVVALAAAGPARPHLVPFVAALAVSR